MERGCQQVPLNFKIKTKMSDVKETIETASHASISGVSWRKSWFYPFLWALATGAVMKLISSDDGWVFNDFLAGWVSCTALLASREFYAS